MSPPHEEEVSNSYPCMVVAHKDPAFVAAVSRAFRRLGWDVYEARGGPEARRLSRLLAPELLVLGTDLPGESGWLTCDKLSRELPEVKVILLGDPSLSGHEDFANFVGAAALLDERAGPAALVEEVCGTPVS